MSKKVNPSPYQVDGQVTKTKSYARANSNAYFEPVTLESFPESIRPALRELDSDQDGKVQPREVLRAIVA